MVARQLATTFNKPMLSLGEHTMMKHTLAVLTLVGALANTTAHAGCNEVLQELINKRELTQIALLQSGGIMSAQDRKSVV